MKPSELRTSLTLRTGLVLLLASSFLVTVRAADTVESALQRGLVAEEAQRDLRAAAEAYQQAVRLGDQQREAQATAIYRLGEVQRRLGNTDAARVQFLRLLTEFPDQTNLVALARSEVPATSPASAQEQLVGPFLAEAEFQRDTAALQLAKLNKAIANFQTGSRSNLVQLLAFRPNRLLETLLADLNIAEQQRSRVDPDFGPQHPEMLRIVGLLKTLNQQLQDVAQGIKAALIEEQASTSLLVARLEGRVASLKELQRANQLNPRNTDIVDLLKTPSQTPAISPEEAEELERLKKLAAESPDLLRRDDAGLTPLQKAASKGWTNVAVYLLDVGVPPNDASQKDRRTALHLAARNGDLPLITLLLDRGADVNSLGLNSETPLHSATRAGRRTVAAELIRRGANLDSRASSAPGGGIGGNTPLHLAAFDGMPAMVELLLRSGASISATNNNGMTPLVMAIHGNQTGTFRLLLEAGSDPNLMAITTSGSMLPGGSAMSVWTPLLFASSRNQVDTVKSLLNHGVSARTSDLQGYTPLHLTQNREIAKALLSKGADVNSQAFYGHTPLDLAKGYESAEVIREAGGTNNLGGNQLSITTRSTRRVAQVAGEMVGKLDLDEPATNSRLLLRESITRLAPPPTADLTRVSIRRPTPIGSTNWIVDLTNTNLPDTEIIAGDWIYVPARPVKK